MYLFYLDMKKKFCLCFKEYCNLFCVDDKYKIKVWKLGYLVVVVERWKFVLVVMGKWFEVSDNDFIKFFIILRIVFFMKIFDFIEEIFYVGKVLVIFKEFVFELFFF